ncbi:MAG: hypothetical protein HY698_17265 [Deltaproteobacteria bacterium]|nr:hypothetical protein [Deltaproteobacteria bacterium]
MRPAILAFMLMLFGLAPSIPAQANPLAKLSDEDLSSYRWQRDKEFFAQAGARFLEDLRSRDKELAAAVLDAARYDIQQEEADKFARQKKFVLAAYGVLWGILVVFVTAIWLRQRRLTAALDDLEQKLKKAKAA